MLAVVAKVTVASSNSTTRIMFYDGDGTSVSGDPTFYGILKEAAGTCASYGLLYGAAALSA